MPIMFDDQGRLKPLGAVERTLFDENFTTGAVSSALETSGATFTPLPGLPSMTLTTGAVSGDSAYVQTPIFTSTIYDAILFEVQGITMSSSSVGLEIGLQGTSTTVAKFRQDSANSDTTGAIIVGSAVASQPRINVRINNENTRRKKISVIWLRRSKEFYVLINDGIYGYLQSSTYNGAGSDVRLVMKLTTRQAAASSLTAMRLRAVAWF